MATQAIPSPAASSDRRRTEPTRFVDWQCSVAKCGAINANSRESCRMCGQAKSSGAQTPLPFTLADITLLSDIAEGFSTNLHDDRLDDLRKRMREAIEAAIKNDNIVTVEGYRREAEKLRGHIRDLEEIVRIRDLTMTRLLAQADAMLAAPKPVGVTQIHDAGGFEGAMIVMESGSVFRKVLGDVAPRKYEWQESDPVPGTRAAIRRQMNETMEMLTPQDDESLTHCDDLRDRLEILEARAHDAEIVR
ncbi:MAG TPA: hypothetical protein VIP11_03915 [Gemmatimonadaceae bacterium]